ncbi:pol polyprotein-like protein [Leptotrombidium deliense]|uniref:Pol polyprotein-like protein n=1 Tax=Leptotrombidium deliense TaxID=299467 RepID=A0A443RYJ5_9ACAR|nr:pol polyprotein-like protein [Leptotrombidium deliense]
MIAHYVNDNHTDWDRFLAHLVFAYNTSIHETTGYSPFFLLHGYEADLSIDVALNLPNTESQYAFENIRYAQEARQIAAEVTGVSQLNAKERFDKKRCEVEFKEGDLVYLKTPNRQPGKTEKLLGQYSGPFVFIRQTAPNNYEVSNTTGNKVDIVSVERMKPFVVRQIESCDNTILPDNQKRKVHFNNDVKVDLTHRTTLRDQQSTINETRVQMYRRSARLKNKSSNT